MRCARSVSEIPYGLLLTRIYVVVGESKRTKGQIYAVLPVRFSRVLSNRAAGRQLAACLAAHCCR